MDRNPTDDMFLQQVLMDAADDGWLKEAAAKGEDAFKKAFEERLPSLMARRIERNEDMLAHRDEVAPALAREVRRRIKEAAVELNRRESASRLTR